MLFQSSKTRKGLKMNSIIEINNLSMRYGNNLVLKNLNLEVHEGQIIGYIGPNGAGKSTTVKIMLGLVNGYEGEVKLFGKDIANGDVSYKQRIGYVPEVTEIYDSLTAREYLTFCGELYGLSYEDAESKSFELMKLFGIENVFDARISSYSKGMRQKILIISSLIHNPDILFLDEPLAGLDANSVIIVKELLALLASRGKTIFYSSHIMDVVEKISNRIVLLDKGEVIADGSFAELKGNVAEGSLESIFNQLTGYTEHVKVAESIVCIVEDKAYEGL